MRVFYGGEQLKMKIEGYAQAFEGLSDQRNIDFLKLSQNGFSALTQH